MRKVSLIAYDIEQIVTYMKSIYHEQVDGYNRLDTLALTQEAYKELRTLDDRGETIPVEFQIACARVVKWHNEQ